MFSRLRIASQLAIGFGAILLLLLGISVLANFGSQRSRDTLDAVAKMKGDEVLEQRVERRIYEARMHFWIAVNSKDPDDWAKATHDFTVAAEWVGDLLKSTTETDRAAKVKNLVDSVTRYRKIADNLAQKQKDNAESQDEMTVAEINELMKPILEVHTIEAAMTKQGEELSNDYRDASAKMVADAQAVGEFLADRDHRGRNRWRRHRIVVRFAVHPQHRSSRSST